MWSSRRKRKRRRTKSGKENEIGGRWTICVHLNFETIIKCRIIVAHITLRIVYYVYWDIDILDNIDIKSSNSTVCSLYLLVVGRTIWGWVWYMKI